MIAIICAMRVELEQILARMENVRQEEQAGVKIYVGVLEGHQAAAAVCGVGKVSAALCTQMLISRYAPSALLHSGIAGGVSPELRHMDLVVARELTYRDMSDDIKRDWLPCGGCFVADAGLSSLLRQAAPEARLGCIATGDQFLESREEKLRLQQDYNALCADMESAAVAQVCIVNRVPFAVLRCISDLADDEARGDYDQFEQKAAHLSAEILCKAVARME